MALQIAPMLAHSKVAPDECFTSLLYWAQEKLDGERRLLHIGEERFMTGRRILKETGRLSEIIEKVPHLDEAAWDALHGTILDGELMHPNGFSTLASIMRSKTPRALDIQADVGPLTYHVYDILAYKGESLLDKPYLERAQVLDKVMTELPDSVRPHIFPVPAVKTLQQKQALYEQVLAKPDGEGLIFRHVHGTYEVGKRSLKLLKLKKEVTKDVVVLGFMPSTRLYTGKSIDTWTYWEHPETLDLHEGARPGEDWQPVTSGHFYGYPGTVVFGQYDAKGEMRQLGKCGGFDTDTAKWMKDKPEDWLHTVIEVTGNAEFADTLALRHPRFMRRRDDKDARSCVIGT